MDRYIIYKNKEKLGENLTFEALQYIVNGLLDNHDEDDEVMNLQIGKMNHWYKYNSNKTNEKVYTINLEMPEIDDIEELL